MKLKAYAKVNFWLKVWKPEKNEQYHKINSLITRVDDLYDVIKLKPNKKSKDIIICKNKSLVENNFIYSVLDILRSFKTINKYYTIKLKKNIPIGSGLGGGTSDAITIANYFLDKFKNNNSKLKFEICNAVGFDSYFFMSKFKTAIASGYGEIIKPIDLDISISKKSLIINSINCSTKEVYKNYKETKPNELNDLTDTAIKLYPNLKNFISLGIMSGSGSTFIKKSFYNRNSIIMKTFSVLFNI
ncbi:hypothetical protein [Spiroplasma turonicum]|uniref:4-diphosphocytidyl-2-C-methyl-D-erythritol kinase n=1 Tax=Spiroplasma turonicum TaxID=216946 RepID=A0A0K1P7P3_9MOLU|nr:hypothetical protein [Spiroplasma turonicum]AKU80318.1 4-diphosphocytidyl-2-C-methyl-D-erythritol kinase [Spiroplasma turonicum]ALX71319.1 4-diphosphocytidyl-2-C-methyl-D-erythritol kinase [Spiroplasma turonicum]